MMADVLLTVVAEIKYRQWVQKLMAEAYMSPFNTGYLMICL